MNILKLAGVMTAAAALAASPAHVAAQASASVNMGIDLRQHPEGAEVTGLLPEGTGSAMGVKVGDIIVEVNGRPISAQVVQEHTEKTVVGDEVRFRVKRADSLIDLTGKALAEQDDAQSSPSS